MSLPSSRQIEYHLRSSLLYALVLAGILTCAGCHENRGSAVDAYAPPHDTNVGPIPGDVSAVHAETDPYLQDRFALQEGRYLFGWYNCAGCHGDHGGGGMGPSLRDATWIYGSRSDQIFNTLVYGRSKGMPAWGDKIPADQMWKITAYVKSLNTPLEPEPPAPRAQEEVPISDISPAPWTSAL
jgi:cytochrome c oxidase cbb3-type subunit 3